jgi:hypothetical protein
MRLALECKAAQKTILGSLFNERLKIPTPDPFLKECCAIPGRGEEYFYVVLAPYTGPKPRKEEIPRPDFGGGARDEGFIGGLLNLFQKGQSSGLGG